MAVTEKTVKIVPFSDLNLLDIGHSIQLAGAVYSGNGKMYLMLYPDEQLESQEVMVMEMTTDEWLQVIRQSDLLETEVMAKTPDGSIGKAVIRKSTRQIEQGVSWAVYRRDGMKCCYCGNDSTPLTVDHLVCWEEGGPSIEANLVTCCRRCNKARSNTAYAEWITQDPHYARVSKNLTEACRQANIALIPTLDKIPRKVHITSR